MRFLLDTNVLSEPLRPAPNDKVATWLRRAGPDTTAASVLSLGEIERGVTLMAAGAHRDRLSRWLRSELVFQLGGRILPVDAAIASAWGRLSAAGRTAGRPLPDIDGLLLATAQVHGLTLVTRNTRDCAGRGVPTLDPWA